MFRKLKIRMTLINLSMLTLVLVLIFSGIYFTMKRGMDLQSDLFMTRVAEEGHLIPFPGPPEVHRQGGYYFLIETDLSGKLRNLTPDLPISRSAAAEIAALTLGNPVEKGQLHYEGSYLKFLKATNESGSILVFFDRGAERSVLQRLLAAFLLVGLVSLCLVFIISLYLASRALVPVKEAWEKQKTFVADASHELRTPLSVIRTNLELVMGNPEDTVESQSKWLENVQSEAKRMSRLVEDLLFLARADSGEEKLTHAPFDMSRAAELTARLFEPMAEEKEITLCTRVPDSIEFQGNEGRLRQLMTILLDNAIKHTPPKGEVGMALAENENSLEIKVWDTGEGIADEHIDKIFERFYRIDKARSRSEGGIGLGLSIARCIIQEHNGSIHVASTPGQGTTFRVLLPKT